MFETIESNNNSFGHAGAAACENDVEWVITLEPEWWRGFTSSESFIVSCGVKDERRLGDGLKCAECVRPEALCQSGHKAGRILPRRERRRPFPVRDAQGLRLERGRRRTVPEVGSQGIRISA
jgi:hypothetical protein